MSEWFWLQVIENRYSIVLNRRLSHRTRRAWMSSLKAQTYQCCGSAFLCFSSLPPTWSESLILRLIRDPSSCPNIQRKRRDHFFFFIHKSRQYYNKSPCIHHPAPKGINLEPLLLNLYSILLSLAMFLRTKECFSKVLFKKEKLERSFDLL